MKLIEYLNTLKNVTVNIRRRDKDYDRALLGNCNIQYAKERVIENNACNWNVVDKTIKGNHIEIIIKEDL